MGKLLAWGGALYLVRYELGQLQIHRVDVGAEVKKVSLRVCSVSSDRGAAALPADARLVALKEVEDTQLATRYPVLVFQTTQAVESLRGSDSPVTWKRRRSTKYSEVVAANGDESMEPLAADQLHFYILYETETGEIGLRCLNVLELPLRTGANVNEGAAVAGDVEGSQLQVFLMDGPYVLLFERLSKEATLLKLHRGKQEGHEIGFFPWREQVDVSCGMKDDTSAAIKVVSCTYVSDTYSTNPHILVHVLCLLSSTSDGDHHIWSVLHEDIEMEERTPTDAPRKCLYLSSFHSTAARNAIMSKIEQVTCSCFISQLNEWEFEASLSGDMASLKSWECDSKTLPLGTELSISTLVVTGTTGNAVYAYTNGILLASFVLPSRPAHVWCMSEDKTDQHCVLGIRCDDTNRSFYMLRVSTRMQRPSMELLLAFNHVGHAYVGSFANDHIAGVSALTQVLLLNDVPGVADSDTDSNGNEKDIDICLDNYQLVKRSVLITQKPDTKLSCHRLRLRDEKKTKNDSRLRKRSRNDEKATSEGTEADLKLQPFRYIERIQKSSSRDTSSNQFDGTKDALAASSTQLDKLGGSLATRLRNGQRELERLQLIVNDKISLSYQLNQLLLRMWRKQSTSPGRTKYALTPPSSFQEGESSYTPCRGLIDMETIVDAASAIIISSNNSNGNSSSSLMSEIRVDRQATLERFRVVKYVPSSSLLHVEVILKNVSDTMLEDSYAVLTAPKAEPMSTQGWTCSSSIVSEFQPEGKARFVLQIQFAPSFRFLRVRKVLEAMLWLHWSIFPTVQTQNRQPSVFGLAVASVNFSPEDVLDAVLANDQVNCRDGFVSNPQEQDSLLFLSSGSSLVSWFGNSKLFSPLSSIVRPTFAVVSINAMEHELMLYELSQMIASLPPDVFAMRNPFQQQHFRTLQRVLSAMRQEIQTFQRPTIAANENGAGPTFASKAEHDSRASIRRARQQETDLQAHQLMQALQKRVNFHAMWFDAALSD